MLKSFQPLPSEAQQGPVSNEVWCGGKDWTRIPEMHCWAQDGLGSHSPWAKTICVTLGKSFSLPGSIILFGKEKKGKRKEIDIRIPKILWPGFFLYNADSAEHWSQEGLGREMIPWAKYTGKVAYNLPFPAKVMKSPAIVGVTGKYYKDSERQIVYVLSHLWILVLIFI